MATSWLVGNVMYSFFHNKNRDLTLIRPKLMHPRNNLLLAMILPPQKTRLASATHSTPPCNTNLVAYAEIMSPFSKSDNPTYTFVASYQRSFGRCRCGTAAITGVDVAVADAA